MNDISSCGSDHHPTMPTSMKAVDIATVPSAQRNRAQGSSGTPGKLCPPARISAW